jgi:hypothetical protein
VNEDTLAHWGAVASNERKQKTTSHGLKYKILIFRNRSVLLAWIIGETRPIKMGKPI